jgi:hypothetical protein
MRVRIGGRLALLIGFASWNLVYGSSVNYYYGYSSPNLATTSASTGDSYGSQNVTFVPQVPMVVSVNSTVYTSTNSSPAATAWSAVTTVVSAASSYTLGSAYSYAAPATYQQPVSQPQQTSTYTPPPATVWAPITNGFSVYQSSISPSMQGLIPTVVASNPYQPSGISYGQTTYGQYTYTNVNMGNSGWYGGSTSTYVDPSYSVPNVGMWQDVSYSVTPRVTPVVTGPVSPIVQPLPPAPIVGPPGVGLVTAPEPSTVFPVAVGLVLVLFGVRRRMA